MGVSHKLRHRLASLLVKKAERSEPKKDKNSGGGDGGSVVLVPRKKEAESSVSNFLGESNTMVINAKSCSVQAML